MRFSHIDPTLFVTEDGRVYRHGIREMAQSRTNKWLRVSYRDEGRGLISHSVSRLVAFAYCDGYFPGAKVGYKDGNKLNNHYNNLYWTKNTGTSAKGIADGLTASKSLSLRPSPLQPDLHVTEDGQVFKSNGFKPTPWVDRDGYLRVSYRSTTLRTNYSIHRLVASAYCAGFDAELTVDHVDGNKLNNHYTNLEWVTSGHNTHRAWKAGLKVGKKGEDSHRTTMKNETVWAIRDALLTGATCRSVAELFGVTKQTVNKIKLGKSWSHILRDKDKHIRSGARIGELAVKSKLVTSDIVKIRERVAAGESTKFIARDYEVSRGYVSAVARGEKWKHILPKPPVTQDNTETKNDK